MQRLVLQVTALIYNGKLLSTAVMLDNLAEKVEKCLLNRSCYVRIGTAKAVRYMK